MDLKKRIEENRLYAFSCYVRDWKRQDPSTIARDGDTFSYRTKRGLVKRFRIAKTLSDTSVKVQGFIFDEIK